MKTYQIKIKIEQTYFSVVEAEDWQSASEHCDNLNLVDLNIDDEPVEQELIDIEIIGEI